MITRISVAGIKKGMFVEMVECAETNCSKRRFLIETDEDVNAILASPAAFVLINTALGADNAKARTVAESTGVKKPLSREEAWSNASEIMVNSTKILKSELITLVTGRAFNLRNISEMIDKIAESDEPTSSLLFEVSRLKQKDETTFQHSLAVGILMAKLGGALGLERETVELLTFAGMVHDVGKLTMPNNILQKDGPLTAAERRIIQSHPRRGHHILQRYSNIPDEVLRICLHHHETLDGSGYPSRLSGSKICPLVRISTVCDVFEALTSARPYKRGWTVSEAISWMFERDHLFDRKFVLRLSATIGSPI